MNSANWVTRFMSSHLFRGIAAIRLTSVGRTPRGAGARRSWIGVQWYDSTPLLALISATFGAVLLASLDSPFSLSLRAFAQVEDDESM